MNRTARLVEESSVYIYSLNQWHRGLIGQGAARVRSTRFWPPLWAHKEGGGGQTLKLCYNLQSNFHVNDQKNANTRAFSQEKCLYEN